MNLKQFKYVLLLSQIGTFSGAAEALNISQPSLSQYIKNIEKQIGMPLFERANGEVRLTDAGQIYIDAGRKILDLEHQMANQLSDISHYRGGTISIGISPYRSVHFMPGVLKKFDQLYPGIKLVVKERSGKELIKSAERGEFDICIIALPVDDEKFSVVPIHREEIVIAVNRSSELCAKLSREAVFDPARRYPIVDINLINNEWFAMLSEYMPMREATDSLLNRNRACIREKIEVSSNEALLSIVDSGVCASLVPSGLTNQANLQTAFFSIKQEAAFRDIAVIYRKKQYLSKPIEDLIGMFKALN